MGSSGKKHSTHRFQRNPVLPFAAEERTVPWSRRGQRANPSVSRMWISLSYQ